MKVKKWIILAGIGCIGTGNAVASSRVQLATSMETVLAPLTTEKIWRVDPGESMPHRRRWVVERRLEIDGIRAISRGDQFGVTIGGLELLSLLHIRGPGPWFQGWESFPCGQGIESAWGRVFANPEGSAVASAEAAAFWERTVSAGRPDLERRLSQVRTRTEGSAVALGRALLAIWLKDLDSRWRTRSDQVARQAEWRHYLRQVSEGGHCAPSVRKGKRLPPAPSWDARMEPVTGPVRAELLARAPAKRWDGYYSIRVMARVGDVLLNGQFLIDPSAEVSLVAPSWLNRQGIDPRLIAAPGFVPATVEWIRDRSVVAFVSFDDVSVGGRSLDNPVWGLLETEVFFPPAYPGLCCDGVLGRDFLRKFPIEFEPGSQTDGLPAVNVYEPVGFQLDSSVRWREMEAAPRKDFGEKFKSRSVVYDFPHGRIWNPKE